MKIENFQEVLKEKLTPIALKLDNQKHLQAIKDGMLGAIPILIIGSFCLLPLALNNLLPACGLKTFLSANIGIFTYPTAFTTDIVSFFIAYGIADSLTKSYRLKSKNPGLTAIAVQFILCVTKIDGNFSMKYAGSKGIFVAIIAAFMVVGITKFMRDKNLVIKMPAGVPPMVADSMSALFPAALSIILGTAVSLLSVHFAGVPFPGLLEKLLSPIMTSIDSLWFVMIAVFFTQLLWFLGLHGQSIVAVIWQPFAIQYAAENAANFANGLPVEHIFTNHFFLTMIAASGSGLTLGLVIMMARSKSKSLKAVGKVSLIPAFFGINEPVIYGCPIVMNPFLFIPFIFGPVLVAMIDYLALATGIVGKAIVIPPGFMPPGVGAFLMTLDWKAPVLVIASLIAMTIFYYPFFKAMEANEIAKEQTEIQNS